MTGLVDQGGLFDPTRSCGVPPCATAVREGAPLATPESQHAERPKIALPQVGERWALKVAVIPCKAGECVEVLASGVDRVLVRSLELKSWSVWVNPRALVCLEEEAPTA